MPFFGSLAGLFGRVLLVAAAVVAVVPEITMFAGSGVGGYFDGSVQLSDVTKITVDSEGNVYVGENTRIRKITPAGVVTTFAGNASSTFTDGTGTSATFNNVQGMAFDSAGNLYVADYTNNRIRRITPAGVVTTFAGNGGTTFTNGTGTSATFNRPQGVGVDSAGNVYVADYSNDRIRRITPAGVVTTFAGSGANGFQNGTGSNATFNGPCGIAVDSVGNVYVVENGNHVIRRITPAGVVSTFAGGGDSLEGTGTNAIFSNPGGGIAIDSAGNLYVTDQINNRIAKITPAGVVTTLAGNGTIGADNGTGTNATFRYPDGIGVDSTGNLYVCDANTTIVRKITPTGVVSTFAGSGVAGFTDSLNNYSFRNPTAIALDSTRNLYIADEGNHRIRKITPEGVVSTLAGNGSLAQGNGYQDGTGTNALFFQPAGVAVDSVGNVYVSDSVNYRIRKITPEGVVTTFAGSGTFGFANGTGTNASFKGIQGLAFDSSGILYVADYTNHAVRKITPLGVVTTLFGNGFSGTLNLPVGITVDSSSNVYVTRLSHEILKITSAGVVTNFAGNGTSGTTDGTGTNARFNGPWGLAVDSGGNVFVADSSGNRIRRITPAREVSTFLTAVNYPVGIAVNSSNEVYVSAYNTGLISRISSVGGVLTTLAGGSIGFSDGGWFLQPVGAVIDRDGTVYVADTNNHRIRRITSAGVVSTFAGSGIIGAVNGSGTSATFRFPQGVAVDSAGTVYVADSGNSRIRAITSARLVTFFAGSGTSGSGDGTGTNSSFNTPVGITVDSVGTIYVSDIGNHRIRRITSAGVVTTFAGTTQGFQDGVGTNARFDTPSGIVADIYGNVYVADTNNHDIRRITSDGTVTTLAGSTAGYADGTGTNAKFNFPYHLSIDALGTLYVADQTNNRIRTVQTSTGVVSTLAGDGTAGFTPSRFNTPRGITVDRFRNAYVADSGNHSIRKIPNAYTLPENNGVVTTIAGSGVASPFTDANGINATFNQPRGIGIDSVGNLYVADTLNQRVRKITPAGVVTTLAGQTARGSTNGTGAGASFNDPFGIAVDSAGNVYVSEDGMRIRRITSTGVTTTLAGSGTQASIDGTGTSASFDTPRGIAVDSAGNVYVSENNTHRIRRITPDGVVTTFAGSSQGSANGTGTNATFSFPQGVAVDSAGTVYVADQSNNRIRKITPAGVVTTLAGSTAGSADGIGTSATFTNPRALTVDSAGNVYVSDSTNNRIRRITPAGVVTTLAGSTSGYTDGTGTNAQFNGPFGIVVDSAGTLYLSDYTNRRIRKIGSGVPQVPLNRAVVTTFAGSATAGATNATGTNATFNWPYEVTVDSVGNVYVADYINNRIRKITPAGVVTTLAGSGTSGSTNGTGAGATFSGPQGVAVDSGGNVYVADIGNDRIRKITPAGVVTTFAGSTYGYLDGTGTNALFKAPTGVAVDSSGNVYVADSNNDRIRRITPDGVVTTLAGTTRGYLDGTGTNASFNVPQRIAVDSAGVVYVTDGNNYRIRRITSAGVVTTLAGNGSQGLTNGTGTNASFYTPQGIAVDSVGNVYITDYIIRRITPAGVVTTLAGNAWGGSAINGIGTNAKFNQPAGVAVNSGGILYVADTFNNHIRKIQ